MILSIMNQNYFIIYNSIYMEIFTIIQIWLDYNLSINELILIIINNHPNFISYLNTDEVFNFINLLGQDGRLMFSDNHYYFRLSEYDKLQLFIKIFNKSVNIGQPGITLIYDILPGLLDNIKPSYSSFSLLNNLPNLMFFYYSSLFLIFFYIILYNNILVLG